MEPGRGAPRAVLSLPVSSAQAPGLVPWVCSEEEEASVSEPHAGPSRARWSRVCLCAPAPGPQVHFVFLERGLLSRAAVCSAVVKSGFATSGRPASPEVKANGGNSGAGDRQRDTALRGTGSCLPATRMVSCPPLCGWLRVRGFSLPPLQDVQNKLKESAQCVGDEFMNCKLAARAKVLT